MTTFSNPPIIEGPGPTRPTGPDVGRGLRDLRALGHLAAAVASVR